MNHVEHRLAVRSKLESYIHDKFYKLLNEELAKYDKYHIEFLIDDGKWSVTTSVNIKYSSTGWYQHDDKEVITHTSITGKIYIDNKLAGDFTINHESGIGFTNLHETIQQAIESIDLLQLQEGHTKNNDFLISNLMEEVFEEEIGDEEKDPRVLDVMAGLQTMNYPKRRALKLAREITRKYPDTHDTDTLVEEALNLIEITMDDSVENLQT